MPGQSRPVLVFAWDQFGPYHMDRLEALAEHLAGRCDIVGIELVSRGEIYGWKPTGPGRRFRKITLFPGRERAEVSAWRHLTALLAACVTSGARHVFLCDFQLPQIFLAAVILRFLGRRVVVMQDSKFDDKPRRLSRARRQSCQSCLRPVCGLAFFVLAKGVRMRRGALPYDAC